MTFLGASDWEIVTQSMELMDQDFPSYCKGVKGSIHSHLSFNIAAMCEWFLLGTFLVLTITKLHRELYNWPSPNVTDAKEQELPTTAKPVPQTYGAETSSLNDANLAD